MRNEYEKIYIHLYFDNKIVIGKRDWQCKLYCVKVVELRFSSWKHFYWWNMQTWSDPIKITGIFSVKNCLHLFNQTHVTCTCVIKTIDGFSTKM